MTVEWAVSSWFDLLGVTVIVCRLTLLLTRDDLFAGLRDWADRAEAGKPCPDPRDTRIGNSGMEYPALVCRPWYGWWVGKITGCPWCCSPYIAAGAWAWWYFLPAGAFVGAMFVCGASLVAGLVGEWLE